MKKADLINLLNSDNRFEFEIFECIGSTSEYLKSKAKDGAKEGLVAIAQAQTAGIGRMNRAFSSPKGSGIYMSVLLRPQEAACDGITLTVCAAVAVYEAIKEITGIDTDIKWVNDLYLSEKKICGILTQGAIAQNGSDFEYAVLGIGLNLCNTFAGTELEDIATGLYQSLSQEKIEALKCSLIVKILQRFFVYYSNGMKASKTTLLSKYRNRLFIIGKQVTVISYTGEYEATVIDLNDDFSLKIRTTDGNYHNLNSGEVRLKLK